MSMPAERLSSRKQLDVLLQGMATAPAVDIAGVAADSRRVGPGFLFLATAGIRSHGLDYIDAALRAGAAAVAWDAASAPAPKIAADIPLVAVAGLARHLGEIANRFYDWPCRSVNVVGITGTNGKSTVAWLLAQCYETLGHRCGYVGTLGAGIGEITSNATMTTPGAVELIECLAGFRDARATHAAIEVSSHALDQNRVDGIEFGSVMFTNLSRDHLDYHGDMERYGAAKAKLFTAYPVRHRIVNLDSEFGTRLAALCGKDVIAVSTDTGRAVPRGAFVFVRRAEFTGSGSELRVSTSWGDAEFLLPLPGDFNIANSAIVLAQLLADKFSLQEACTALGSVSAPPGRMQKVTAAAGQPSVYIDYAHTPAAIEAALRALRLHGRGRIWCVFGCGGDRDKGKRPLMAAAAERLADRVVITSDNPRSESPRLIIDQVLAGFADPGAATVIEDRAAAIAWTIAQAAPEDTVLVAGKGHEGYQIVGNDRRNFSDYGVAAAQLAALAEHSQ